MRPTLRPQGRNPVPPRGTGFPPPVPRPGGGRAGSSWGASRPPSSPAWAQAPRPSAVAAAGRGSLRPSLSRAPLCCLGLVWGRVCPPPFFATSRLAGGSGAVPCRGAASPLSWSVPVAGSPSLPALRAAAAAPVAPFRPCPPAFPPVPPAVGLGLCRVAPLQARQAWFFGAAGSPPLRRGVLPPLVLGFALPPFAPPSRGVGALCGAGSPCVLRVGCRVPPGALALRASGGGRSVRRGYAGACAPAFCAPPRRCFAACARAAMPVGVGRGCSAAALAGGVVFRVWGVCRCGRARGSCAPRTPSARGAFVPLSPPPLSPWGKGGARPMASPAGGIMGAQGCQGQAALPGLAPPLTPLSPMMCGRQAL